MGLRASNLPVLVLLSCTAPPVEDAVTVSGLATETFDIEYETPGLTEEDIPGFVARMTLEEKIGQLVKTDVAVATPADVRDYHLGSVISLIPDGNLKDPRR